MNGEGRRVYNTLVPAKPTVKEGCVNAFDHKL